MDPMRDLEVDTQMPIATVSRLLDIPIPTIRSWERRYGFPSPGRTQGRHRRYTVTEADQLRLLRDEIARGHQTRDAVAIARKATAATGPRPALMERLLHAAMRLDPTELRTTLDEATESLGVEPAITDIALPAMREMGSRWKAGVCDTAHEHLATEAVRVWLGRHISQAPPPFRPWPIVLSCGPKDLHTIGLEAFAVILARRGWPVRTLGALTPVDSLVAAVRAAEARAVVVTSQRSSTRRAAAEALAAVDALPGVSAFYAGMGFAPKGSRTEVAGTYLGDDLLGAAEILERGMSA
jgi:DNA-binding transcriptional MerR regulator